MIVLLDLEWIIARLETEVPTLKLVGGAVDLASASASLKQTPSAFVIPSSERASGNSTGTMVVSQNNITRFAVVSAVRNLRDPRGGKAQGDLRSVRTNILTALHGWQPDADFDPIEYGGGKLMSFNNQVVWYWDELVTANFLRSL